MFHVRAALSRRHRARSERPSRAGHSYDVQSAGPAQQPGRRAATNHWRVAQDLVERLAQVLAALGTERAWVVHGADGLDEITIDGKTLVAEAYEGTVRTFEIAPEDFGLSRGTLDHLRGGDAQANAVIIREVLAGTRRDEARALVVLNAAAALVVGGLCDDPKAAAGLAEKSIDSGEALKKLEQLVKATNE